MGSGAICSDFVQALRSSPKCVITGVAARSLDSAEKFAVANKIPTAYGSYEELAAATDVDIVYIGTIHPTHKKLALMAMNAGKHVLCEKPMTLRRADTAELIAVAKEKDVLLAEAHMTRYFPVVVQAREIIASGGIGDVMQMQGDFGFRFPGVDDANATGSRLVDPCMGGGASLDIGMYPLACMLMAFGCEAPTKIAAVGTLAPSGVDKSVGVTVLCGTKVATISYSIELQTPEEWRIIGTQGTITFKPGAHTPFTMQVTRNGTAREDRSSTDTITPARPVLVPEANPLNFPGSEGLLYEAQAVTDAVRLGQREMPQFTHQDSLMVADMIDSILAQLGVEYPPQAFDA
eukprot:gnl/TRDRNA2_/TRDRNA2_36074_c0_seq1.p1 gnl/TRDRNA2_/TRDRNA2_36074_c0~~gnl/TRDRNA2_/TRDRNA2_36074_c0_seq1.p1  ORF type:complete len:409 (-),score=66.64 gnl/TRDRNA2_/TRDRNA2_36074_c0_seq1:95-1138(-)